MGINAFKERLNIVYISLEMPTEQMWGRVVACYAGLPINNITAATLTDEQKRKYFEALQELQNSENRFEVIDSPGLTVSSIGSEIDSMIEKYKPDIVIVDYLGIVRPSEKGLQDNLAQAAVVEELRELARVWNIPILTAVQLNRESGKSKSKTKGTERLSRSDVIGATADVVLQIEEVDAEDAITKLSDRTTIYVTKNRKGQAPFGFDVRKNFACSQFLDWDMISWKDSQKSHDNPLISSTPLDEVQNEEEQKIDTSESSESRTEGSYVSGPEGG